jgi:hypothetical protein
MSHRNRLFAVACVAAVVGYLPAPALEPVAPPGHLTAAQRRAWEQVAAQRVQMRELKGEGLHAYFL